MNYSEMTDNALIAEVARRMPADLYGPSGDFIARNHRIGGWLQVNPKSRTDQLLLISDIKHEIEQWGWGHSCRRIPTIKMYHARAERYPHIDNFRNHFAAKELTEIRAWCIIFLKATSARNDQMEASSSLPAGVSDNQ